MLKAQIYTFMVQNLICTKKYPITYKYDWIF